MAIHKFRSLTNWIFHQGIDDYVRGAVRKSAVLGYLGSKISGIIKKSVEIWMNEEQRLSMSWSIAAESEQLLGLLRRAALSLEK